MLALDAIGSFADAVEFALHVHRSVCSLRFCRTPAVPGFESSGRCRTSATAADSEHLLFSLRLVPAEFFEQLFMHHKYECMQASYV